jgi:hypothetical protein
MYPGMTPGAPAQDMTTGAAAGGSQYGTPPPAASPYGAPTANRYGGLSSPSGTTP